MRQAPLVAEFNMSQSDLIMASFAKQLVMVRDAPELAVRGVAAARIAGLRTQAEAFAALPTDGELDQAKQATTAAKAQARQQALAQMQLVMGIVGTVHKPGTSGYKRFGSASLDTAGEGDLYLGLVRVVRVGRAHLAAFAAAGLTAAMLTELETRTAAFLARLGEQQDAEADRTHAAEARLLAANALYAELIALCGIGKALYAQTDARKYQDYVVNETPSPAAP